MNPHVGDEKKVTKFVQNLATELIVGTSCTICGGRSVGDGLGANFSRKPVGNLRKLNLLSVKQPFVILVFGLGQELATKWFYDCLRG